MKCDVAFPVEGFPIDDIKSFSVSNVTFEPNKPEVFPRLKQALVQQNIKEEIRILGEVRDIEGNDVGEIKDLAYQSVDRAVNVVQFLVTPALRTVDEVYCIKRHEGPEVDREFKILSKVTASFRLDGLFPGPRFDSQKYIEENLGLFDAMRHNRKNTLEKALSYYRIALCACNSYQAIESFFGAVQAIIIEMRVTKSSEDIKEKEIKKYMKPIIVSNVRGTTDDIFYNKFRCFWGIYRSGGTHGKYHVNDYSKLREASIAKSEVARWTHIIIRDYIEKSTKP